MTSPTVVFSCIILALLKTNIQHSDNTEHQWANVTHPESYTKIRRKCGCVWTYWINLDEPQIWIYSKFLRQPRILTSFHNGWKIFIIDAATKTSQLAIRKQARQIKGGNSVIIVLIMVKAFQFSEINLTYRMLPFFRLNRTGYII